MAQFKEPGFKTRQAQRDAARGIKAVPCLPMKHGLTSWMARELRDIAKANPCRELAFGRGIVSKINDDPFRLPGHKARMEGPKRARPKQLWDNFDTHKPRGWRTVFRDSYRYTRRLEAHGWHPLGSGFYSTVLGKPGCDKVIKICRNGGDDAYPMFAAWCVQNPSPYLPRIHSFKRHNGFYVVVLDRLAKTTAQAHPNTGWSQTTDMIQGYARGHEFNGMRKVFLNSVWNELPGLKEVVDRFVEEFRGQASFDMHDGNWMLTEDGKLVMTDPLAGTNTDKASERNSSVKRIRGGALRAAVRLAA
jgi:hypothetical protein